MVSINNQYDFENIAKLENMEETRIDEQMKFKCNNWQIIIYNLFPIFQIIKNVIGIKKKIKRGVEKCKSSNLL